LPIKTVRASEISAYVYCARAWWYQHQGIESENQGDLAAGSAIHSRHGRTVLATGCLRTLGYVFLLAAVLLLTASLVIQLVK
jgi:CRISPR/Cas system-associated exonuclease Cas4 (RecB family)